MSDTTEKYIMYGWDPTLCPLSMTLQEAIDAGYVKGGVKVTTKDKRSYLLNLARHTLQYADLMWTVSGVGCGPMAVFDRIDSAKRFLGSWGLGSRICPCYYIPSKEKMLWTPYRKSTDLPRGTVLADAVMLLPYDHNTERETA